jgi:hypothetical protein
MDLQPGQRVTVLDSDGSRVDCEFVRRISDRTIGPYLDAATKQIPQAIIRLPDGTMGIWPLESIQSGSDGPIADELGSEG